MCLVQNIKELIIFVHLIKKENHSKFRELGSLVKKY